MDTSHIDNDITVMTNVPNVRLVFAFTDICYAYEMGRVLENRMSIAMIGL